MSKLKSLSYIIGGILWIVIAITLLLYSEEAVKNISVFLGIMTYFSGFWHLFTLFVPRFKIKSLKQKSLILFEGFLIMAIGTFVFNVSNIIPRWLVYGIGIYQLFIGIVAVINFWLLQKDRARGRLSQLLIAVVNFSWATSSLFSSNSQSVQETIQRLAIYIIFVAVTILLDGRDYFLPEKIKNKVKRQIRIPLPVIFNMFAPKKMLDSINQFLKDELEIEKIVMPVNNKSELLPLLKVFIHVGETGTETMGHVDLSYKGQIYAYGNYDVDSERLFGSIGDGILFSLKESEYINYCMADDKTMFEYQVVINKDQQSELEAQLEMIQQQTIKWQPTSKRQYSSYIGKMYRQYDTKLYKFTSSRYKTYFVLGTNCVLLADQLIGASGLDLIAMVGILAPGTYYEYFEEEYR